MRIDARVNEGIEGHNIVALIQRSFTDLLMKHVRQFIAIKRPKPGVKTMSAILLTEEDARALIKIARRSELTEEEKALVASVMKPYKPATVTIDELREMTVPQLKQLIINCGGTRDDIHDIFRGEIVELAKKTNTPIHPEGLQETWLWCIKAILRRSNDN